MPLALVTGATGLLGANLIPALITAGCRVRAVTRQRLHLDRLKTLAKESSCFEHLEVIEGDIRHSTVRELAVYGVDYLFHALHSHEYWLPNSVIYDVNVTATAALLWALSKTTVTARVIFTSSTSTIGATYSPFDPSSLDTIPRRRFSTLSKYWAEKQVELTADRTNLEVAYLHCPYIIGPMDLRPTPLRLVIPAAQYFPLVVAPPGGGTIVGVEKVVQRHLHAVDDWKPGRREVIRGTNISYADYFALANRLAGRRLRPIKLNAWILKSIAAGSVFDRCFVDYMSSCRYSETGSLSVGELEASMEMTAEWFQTHTPFGGFREFLRYSKRFF
jgi:nucleoside-diphosphate-sugar epimerase